MYVYAVLTTVYTVHPRYFLALLVRCPSPPRPERCPDTYLRVSGRKVSLNHQNNMNMRTTLDHRIYSAEET